VNLFFKGRQLEHLDMGKKLIERVIQDTESFAQVEKGPVLEGKVLSVTLGAK